MKARILVVDDEALMRRAVMRVLRPLGAGLQEAADAQAALQLIAERPPTVVVTDFQMPGKNGRALAEEVHAQYPEVRIVLHSGNAAQDLAGRWWPNFDITIVPKPAAPELLRAVVEAELCASLSAAGRRCDPP